MTCLHFLFTPCRARKADDLPKNFGLLQQMQGAGARAESGGESAMMDQLTAVLRKNRKLQRRLHALMGAGFDREALLATGFVDRPCPKGHQLIAVTGQPYVSGWFCDMCRKCIPRDASDILHCSTCNFDLCRGCQARDWRCPKGHALMCQHGKPSYYPGWSCDGCKKMIPHDTQGVLHCKTCKYDLCHCRQ